MADNSGVPKAMDTSSSTSSRKRRQRDKRERGRKSATNTPKPTSESDADSESSQKTSSSSDLNKPLAKVPKPLDSQEASHDSDRICIDKIQSPMPDKTVPVSDNTNLNDSLIIAEEQLEVSEAHPPPPAEKDDGFTVVSYKKGSRGSASRGSNNTIKPRMHPAERRERQNKRPPLPPRDPTLTTVIYRSSVKGVNLHKCPYKGFAMALSSLRPQPLACRRVFGGGYALDFVPGTDPLPLLNLKELGGFAVTAYVPAPSRTIGTVRGEYDNADQLLEFYRMHPTNPAISHVQRIGTSRAYKLFFVEDSLPDKVTVLYTVMPVEKFFLSPKRCFRCHLFTSHLASSCRGPLICGRCGEVGHDYSHCVSKTIRCVNCNKSHDTAYKFCEHRLFALRVEKARASLSLSYAEAKSVTSKRYLAIKMSRNIQKRSLSQTAKIANDSISRSQGSSNKTTVPASKVTNKQISLSDKKVVSGKTNIISNNSSNVNIFTNKDFPILPPVQSKKNNSLPAGSSKQPKTNAHSCTSPGPAVNTPCLELQNAGQPERSGRASSKSSLLGSSLGSTSDSDHSQHSTQLQNPRSFPNTVSQNNIKLQETNAPVIKPISYSQAVQTETPVTSEGEMEDCHEIPLVPLIIDEDVETFQQNLLSDIINEIHMKSDTESILRNIILYLDPGNTIVDEL